jgi:hypothetical protein
LIRSFTAFVFVCTLSSTAFGQATSTAQKPAPTPEKPAVTPQATSSDKKSNDKSSFSAEQIAESAIFIYGSRPVLEQIRRNGIERGRVTRLMTDGRTEEAVYERRFVRGENSEKDKVRLDQKLPSMEYSLIYGEGRLWGMINGSAFIPRQDTAKTFLSQQRHSVDTLLRYKEDGATLSLVGKDKQKGLDLYVLDLTDKEKQTTRYYISARSLHVLWLEYEDTATTGSSTAKYTRKFLDYRYAQGTLIPYRTVLLEDGKQTQESRIMNITFGIKLDDSLFKNPEA